ncbi:MAG: transposase [Actinomycetota bacterium]|nr:transposase [Actinomycetota bacterium]
MQHEPCSGSGLLRGRIAIQHLSTSWNPPWIDAYLLCFPPQHRRHIRSTNVLERLNEELKRRTKVVLIFPKRQASLSFPCSGMRDS